MLKAHSITRPSTSHAENLKPYKPSLDLWVPWKRNVKEPRAGSLTINACLQLRHPATAKRQTESPQTSHVDSHKECPVAYTITYTGKESQADTTAKDATSCPKLIHELYISTGIHFHTNRAFAGHWHRPHFCKLKPHAYGVGESTSQRDPFTQSNRIKKYSLSLRDYIAAPPNQ